MLTDYSTRWDAGTEQLKPNMDSADLSDAELVSGQVRCLTNKEIRLQRYGCIHAWPAALAFISRSFSP